MSTLMRGSYFTRAAEGVALAFDAIRTAKVRAALTILGVAIGVMVVIAMAAMVTGIRRAVNEQISRGGAGSFMVVRDFSPGFNIDDAASERRRRRPRISAAEAGMIAALPGVEDINVTANGNSRVAFGGRQLGSVTVTGADPSWMRVDGATLAEGRAFTAGENTTRAFVTLINQSAVETLFPGIDPLGKSVRLYNFPFTIIGIYQDASDLFDSPSPKFVIPRSTFYQVSGWNPNWIWGFMVLPREGVSRADAMDEVTVALRVSRGLKPGEDNTFDLVSGDDFMAAFDSFTGIFFLVMLILSSIGLMVGGIGVIAIMLISVTERTREIGVRKALGATRGEIVFQFLVEATTLTVLGGLCGMALGGLIAWGISAFSPVPAVVPLWSILAAIVASTVTGIGFGLYPANKAARLDPVEALRYE